MMQLRHVGIALTIAALAGFLPAGEGKTLSFPPPDSASVTGLGAVADGSRAVPCFPLDASEVAALEAASLRVPAEALDAARGTVSEREDSFDWDAALVLLLVGALIVAVILIQP